MPVFPDVASRRIESGPIRPERSRSSMSARATLSFTDPVGFAASSLASSRTCGDGESRGSSTTGVDPIASTMSPYRPWDVALAGALVRSTRLPARDRGQQPDLVPRVDPRVQAGEVAHVL